MKLDIFKIEARNHVSKNLEEAFSYMLKFIKEGSKTHEKLIVFLGRFREVTLNYSSGTISFDKKDLVTNNIRVGLLSLIKEVKQNELIHQDELEFTKENLIELLNIKKDQIKSLEENIIGLENHISSQNKKIKSLNQDLNQLDSHYLLGQVNKYRDRAEEAVKLRKENTALKNSRKLLNEERLRNKQLEEKLTWIEVKLNEELKVGIMVCDICNGAGKVDKKTLLGVMPGKKCLTCNGEGVRLYSRPS